MNWDRLRSHDDAVQGHLADGDYRRALETLVQAYQHAIVGFCHNMLSDITQAEEVAQDIFLDAYKAMPRFRQQASVRTWLFAIARKKCLQVRRNRDRRRRLVQEKQSVSAQRAHRDAPTAPGEDPEVLFQLVKQGLTQLPAEEGSLLSMRYDTGLSVADIAPILGISTASVRRRLAQALGRLREVINGEA
jgi:RNA polymerase sigma-70 factor (ECF subfamily)